MRPLLFIHPTSLQLSAFAFKCGSISSYSGNRPVSFFEKINSPSSVTSKMPPLDGMISSDSICVLYAPSSCSVRPTAFGR
jgi:hypothetical protein